MGNGRSPRSGAIDGATRWVAASALVVCASAAFARDATPVRPGARVFGELAAGEELTIDVLGVAGMRLDLVCAPFRGDDLVPQFQLSGPDGTAVDLTGHVVVAKHGATTRLKALVLGTSGAYHLTISASSGSGGFDLATSGRRTLRVEGRGDPGASTIGFPALDGDTATLVLRTAKHRHADDTVVRYVDAAGAATAIGRAPPVKQTLTATGTHGFDVAASMPFTWSVALRPAKVDRTWLDAAGLVAEASISGTILVDGADGSAAPPPATAKASRRERPRVQPGDVIVAFPPGKSPPDAAAPVREALDGRECSIVHAMTPSGPFLVRVGHLAASLDDVHRAARTRSLVRGVARRADVAWAECNGIMTAQSVPNDTLWPEQETMRQIRMPEAWDVLAQHGVDGRWTNVAFVDTGIRAHPDLDAAIAPGYSFISAQGWTANPTDLAFHPHGLAVAGVLGAVSGNQLGIAGIIPHAHLVPVRSLYGTVGTFFDVAAGIRWAAGLPVVGAPPNTNPARVINCSIGSQTNSVVVADAVRDAVGAGVLIVAAAGNNGSSTPSYPAGLPGVLAVGALQPNLTRAYYSNFGSWVALWAPVPTVTTGVDLGGNPTYETFEGTSLASPQVAGVAGLMYALNPELDTAKAIDILRTSATDVGGYLLLDAARAAELAVGAIPAHPRVSVLPRRIEAGAATGHARIFVGNSGTGDGFLIQPVMKDEGSTASWLSASLPGTMPWKLPVTVDVAIDQSAMGYGVFESVLHVVTDIGSADVPVRLVRTPPPQLGFVRVHAVRPDGSVAATAVTSAANGWHYTISGLRAGSFTLVADTDSDGTLQIDRVDEWSGAWPLPGEPGVVDVATGADVRGYDFGIVRYDAGFVLSGVAGGSIRGAIAVRATNAVTRDVVPGARVYVGDGVYTGVTDANGRAVLTGDFVAGQTVTVIADGYAPRTRIGFNGQFQSFALTPDTAATARITVVVDGLAQSDASVDVALGNDWQRVAHDGSGSVSAEFTVTQRPVATPVVAVARDAGGVPTRSAFAPMDATLGAPDVWIRLHAGDPPAPPLATSVVVHQPDAAFEATAASTTADVNVRWSADDAPRVGGGEDPAGPELPVRWTAPPGLPPDLGASIRVTAKDAAGRMSSTTIPGTLGAIDVLSHLDLPAPPAMITPLEASSVASVSLTLKFDPTLDSQFQWITLRDVETGGVWEIDARATIRGVVPVVVPSIAERPIVPGHTFVWTVRSVSAPGVSADHYVDEERTAKATDVCESAPRTFTTK